MRKVKALSYAMLPDFRENIAFWKVPRLRLFVLVVSDQDGYGLLWNDTDRRKPE